MFQFHFDLLPIDEVAPWGSEEEPTLSWFGLTDGSYWVEVNDTVLFRYKTDANDDQSTRPLEYEVVRLWEDFMELFSQALEPIPADLREFIASDPVDWADAPKQLVAAALRWHESHRLETSHLSPAPLIRIWRTTDEDGDNVTIAWSHNSDLFAAPAQGIERVPTAEYIAAHKDFDRRLIAAMHDRVNEIVNRGGLPGIDLDPASLEREHYEQRVTKPAWWEWAMDWDSFETDYSGVRSGAALLLAGAVRSNSEVP